MQRDSITGILHTRDRISAGLSVGGGVTSYNELADLPTMNGHIIEGDMTPADLDIWQPKNFSETEQNTGLKWFDGKDIYVKVLTTYDTYTSQTALFNVGDINVLKISGSVNIGTAEVPADYFCIGSHSNFIATFHDIASQTIQCANYGWTISKYNIIIYYTKN